MENSIMHVFRVQHTVLQCILLSKNKHNKNNNKNSNINNSNKNNNNNTNNNHTNKKSYSKEAFADFVIETWLPGFLSTQSPSLVMTGAVVF